MKAARLNNYGGADAIELADIDQPVTKDNQVLVEVKAAAINPFDWKVQSGMFKSMFPLNFPLTIGADFAGTVKEIGSSVTLFKVGDEVYGTAINLGGGSGSMAELASANQANIALKPKNASFEQAACLVLVGVSAIQALDKLNLKEGQKLLIQGGAGGIGSIAVQYAKKLGVYIAATSSAASLDFVKNLGANEVIDYENQKFEGILKDYDAVFDTVGVDVMDRSFKVLKNGGRLISMAGKPNQDLAAEYGVTAMAQNTQTDMGSLDKLRTLVESGDIKAQIDKTFALDEVQKAFKYAETGHPRGKVVVKIS